MVKLLVTSATYRQSSITPSQLAEVDPYNQLFARQSRYRLQAEMIRDNALAVSGLLVNELGGASVKPYQPKAYYQHMNFPQRTYKQHNDSRQWRRGVYMHWQRMFLHPQLLAFDATTREECVAQRSRSNTPKAALTLLNDPTMVEAARVFAQHTLENVKGDDITKIKALYQNAIQRNPSKRELPLLVKILNDHRKQYKADLNAAKQITSVGIAPKNTKLHPAEHAAWTSVARVILNMNETITRN